MSFHILVAPDASQTIVPVYDDSLKRVTAFVGVNDFHVYDRARIREESDQDAFSIRMMTSNWGLFSTWFSTAVHEMDHLSKVCGDWMRNSAGLLIARGCEDGDIVTLDDVSAVFS
jgi:hypothetical protein